MTPRGCGALLELAVELDVDPLVEEAVQARDPHRLGNRVGIAPDEVLGGLAGFEAHRVVGGCALVRAMRDGVGGLELGDDVVDRQVPPGRQVRLE